MANMHPAMIPVIVILTAALGHHVTSYTHETFTAAVYEHDVILADTIFGAPSRQKAVKDMMRNLQVYEQQTIAAAKQGADIIVFPEDGIYGMEFFGDRDRIYPFLEYIPGPELKPSWNPCQNPTLYPGSDVQVFLSCLALNNSIYVVANFGDKQACDKVSDLDCPSDGRYQFNTNVVYDADGTFIARYHKYHLYAERQFDKPKTPGLTSFSTPFGEFGVFTCFDILFKEPAITLIEELNITSIVFPTAWSDAGPFLRAVQFHSSFAIANNVNVLAANIHMPLFRFHGSGIYTPNGAATYYYNTRVFSAGKLLISTLPIVPKPPPIRKNHHHKLNRHFRSISKTDTNELLPNKRHYKRHDTHVSNHKNTVPTYDAFNVQYKHNRSTDSYFTAKIFNDIHNLVMLPEKPSVARATVCHTDLCCQVTYKGKLKARSSNSITRTRSKLLFRPRNIQFQGEDKRSKCRVNSNEFYALAAFSGLHKDDESYYIQVCSLVKCKSDCFSTKCGYFGEETPEGRAMSVKASPQKFSMFGNFSTSYVYPNILLDNQGTVQLTKYPKTWTYNSGHLTTRLPLTLPLDVAYMLGRVYTRDD